MDGKRHADESHLLETVALSERLIEATGGGGRGAAGPLGRLAAAAAALPRALGYWLWRVNGRKAPKAASKVTVARLAQVIENYEAELARAQGRAAELEQRLAAYAQIDRTVAGLERRAAEADARAAEAERTLGHAQSRIEILKDALEVTKATARQGGGDAKFREAKRSFARLYHPDHGSGGPADADRQRLFAEFWPVLERIDRGG